MPDSKLRSAYGSTVIQRRSLIIAGLAGLASFIASPVSALGSGIESAQQAHAAAVAARLWDYQQRLEACSDRYHGASDAYYAARSALEDAQNSFNSISQGIEALGTDVKEGLSPDAFLTAFLEGASKERKSILRLKFELSECKNDLEVFESLEQRMGYELEQARLAWEEAQQLLEAYNAELAAFESSSADLLAAALERLENEAAAEEFEIDFSDVSVAVARLDVLDYAYSRLGCPYAWGASGPNAFDCSGLTSWCYAQAGIDIPHSSSGQYAAASSRIPLSQAQAGDILWSSGHVGIYIGDGAYIHAPGSGHSVCIAYKMSSWRCALRFL